MQTHQLKLVTVITESALESTLIKVVTKIGANGYSITDVRGKGSRGTRNASWDATSNIRMEIVCTQKVADEIAEYLQKNYYDNYAMIIFTRDVDVYRPDKF